MLSGRSLPRHPPRDRAIRSIRTAVELSYSFPCPPRWRDPFQLCQKGVVTGCVCVHTQMAGGRLGSIGGGSVLRVHFSGPDLARVRIAARPDVLWETVLSFHRLRDRRPGAAFGKWRSDARCRLNGETRLLAPLVPTRGYFPDS